MRKVVGIDRKIKRAWIDAALDQLAQTPDAAELRKFIDRHLKNELPGKESRAKTTGIVLRIWTGIPPERVALRDRAVALLPRISGQERIWLHWGMTALAYPFFRDLTEVVGRLLALQDDFTTAQVQGRMLTTWGDRATIKEAAQKLITMLVDWEVLRSTKTKGHFLLARRMTASIPDLQLWLLEALLGASAADEIEAQQLLRLPESFPFTLSIGIADLRRHEGFNIHRQGLDMDMVALRKVKLEPRPKRTKKPKKEMPLTPDQAALFDIEAEETGRSVSEAGAAPMLLAKAQAESDLPDVRNKQRRIEDAVESPVPGMPSDRPARSLQVQGIVLDPIGPYAVPSIQCAEQFRDGHYFACIALAQSVLEAAIRHVSQVKLKKKPNQEGSFDKDLEALHKRKFISDEWKVKLHELWTDRHSFHHLRPSVESDQRKLEETARNALKLLNDLEQEFFEALSEPAPQQLPGH